MAFLLCNTFCVCANIHADTNISLIIYGGLSSARILSRQLGHCGLVHCLCISGKISLKSDIKALVFILQICCCDASLIQCFSHNSLSKKELRRQHKVELSPNRSRSREKGEGRVSPPPLSRPFSVPLDPKVDSDDGSASPSKSSSLQCYQDMGGIKEKAEKWRERKSDGDPTDESSPEIRRRQHKKDDFQ